MDNFDLKGFLKNNTLLNEGKEAVTEEVAKVEETQEIEEASCGSKMKRSELKEKIREEILEAMAKDGDTIQIGEAEEDEEAPESDLDTDVDAELDIENPEEEEEFTVANKVGSVDQVRDVVMDAWNVIGQSGESVKDESLIKMARDGKKYTDRQYPDPTPFGDSEI